MKNVTVTKENQLIVEGEVWEGSSYSKSRYNDKMSARFWGTSLSKVAKPTLRQLSAHFEEVTLDLPTSERWYGWEFDTINIRMDRTLSGKLISWKRMSSTREDAASCMSWVKELSTKR